MKILWVVNIPFPEVCLLMNENPIYSGGWLISAAKNIAIQKNIELFIAFPKDNINRNLKLNGEIITYYGFKTIYDKDINQPSKWNPLKNIVQEVKPDIVHIHGTELAHTLAMVKVCEKEKVNTIITIQGLTSIIKKHVYSNLPLDVIYGFTFRNLLRRDNIKGLQRLYNKRGINEIQAIKAVKHVIGRTTWDKACSLQINPNVNYHFCNESLREEFYMHKWDIEKCEKNSIFLSQSQYPIKGLHLLLEAMPIILKRFPDAKLYISGKNIIKSDSIKDRLLITYYGNYVKRLISKFNLEGKINFTGPLDEKEMCRRYLSSNVFVCPSTIENSPNSLGEAMILGLPCVASDVGGISDMLTHKDEGFIYQADAPYMLAYYICEIFGEKNLAIKFSENARKHALMTHNINANTNTLIEIYKSITDDVKTVKYYQVMGG